MDEDDQLVDDVSDDSDDDEEVDLEQIMKKAQETQKRLKVEEDKKKPQPPQAT